MFLRAGTRPLESPRLSLSLRNSLIDVFRAARLCLALSLARRPVMSRPPTVLPGPEEGNELIK